MKRRYDLAYAAVMILLLVIAYFVGSAMIKGILLLLFSGVLIFNTIMKMKAKKNDKLREKIFMGILLFFASILAISSIYVIVSAIVEAF